MCVWNFLPRDMNPSIFPPPTPQELHTCEVTITPKATFTIFCELHILCIAIFFRNATFTIFSQQILGVKLFLIYVYICVCETSFLRTWTLAFSLPPPPTRTSYLWSNYHAKGTQLLGIKLLVVLIWTHYWNYFFFHQ